MYAVVSVISDCRQGFPDALSRATLFNTLVRTLTGATLRQAIVLYLVAHT